MEECFMYRLRSLLVVLFILLPSILFAKNYVTPTIRVYDIPEFQDDLDFENMILVLDRQITYFQRKNTQNGVFNMNGTITLGTLKYPRARLMKSVKFFKGLIENYNSCKKTKNKEECLALFNKMVKANFNLYAPNVDGNDHDSSLSNSALFTAYYSPVLLGSKSKSDLFQYPIYKKPASSDLSTLSFEDIIFENKLDGNNLELFYVKDLFDLYLLQIEGGGQVKVVNHDGTIEMFYLSYDGSNGKKRNWISKYMIAQGMIEDASVDSQRSYLAANPEKYREIFSYSENYVYFSITDHPPIGVSPYLPLTDFRSMATDSKYYAQKGLISYVVSQRPYRNQNGEIVTKNFSRFFIDQDTGGAIKGKARADLYFGIGEQGELAAHNLCNNGEIYFLIKKTEVANQ